MAALGRIIESHPTPESPNLSHNDLTQGKLVDPPCPWQGRNSDMTPVVLLSDALVLNICLEDLHVSHCTFRKEGAEHIARGLADL